MTKQFYKTISSSLIVFFFLFIAYGSGEKKEKIKTSFNNCDEILSYVKGKSYYKLKETWGEGNVRFSYNLGRGNVRYYKFIVKWNNIKCNNKPIELSFDTNYENEIKYSSYGTIMCSENCR